MGRLGFGHDLRLRSEREFRIVHQDGKFARGKHLNLWAYRGEEIEFIKGRPRLGIVVSRKASRNATCRNQWKRRLREVFRKNQTKFAEGCAILVQTKPPPARAKNVRTPRKKNVPEYNVLEQEFLNLAASAKALR